MAIKTLVDEAKTALLFFYDVKSQLQRYIYSRSAAVFDRGDARRDAIKNKEELAVYQEKLRQDVIFSLGGLPQVDCPLNPKVTGRVEGDGFAVEKVIYQSRPDSFITASLYLPKGQAKPGAAVLFVLGHSGDGKQSSRYQAVSQILARAGLVVLTQDPFGQGERFGYYEAGAAGSVMAGPTSEHDQAGSQCLLTGKYNTRYFIHDAMRSIDYLCQRPEVDPEKIGITGSSGGGTQTSLMMLLEPRIKAAAPTNFLTSRREYIYAGGAQDAEQIWPGYSRLGYDHEDFLLAMAPRPVQVNAVRSAFFPVEGTRRSVGRARRFWAMHGQAEKLVLCEDDSTHMYTDQLARQTAAFMVRQLQGDEVAVENLKAAPLPAKQLWCTSAGQVKKDFPAARFVYEENLAEYEQILQRQKELAEPEKKQAARTWLEAQVLEGREKTDLNLRLQIPQNLKNLKVQSCLWWVLPGIFGHGLLVSDINSLAEEDQPVVLAVWEDGSAALPEKLDFIQEQVARQRKVLVLDLPGSGFLEPARINSRDLKQRFGTLHKLNDDLLFLGDSLAALRTYSILRALDAIKGIPGLAAASISLYLDGQSSQVYGLAAAFLDERITQVEQAGRARPLADFVRQRYYPDYNMRSMVLPGFLQYADLPDLERWLGDRGLGKSKSEVK